MEDLRTLGPLDLVFGLAFTSPKRERPPVRGTKQVRSEEFYKAHRHFKPHHHLTTHHEREGRKSENNLTVPSVLDIFAEPQVGGDSIPTYKQATTTARAR